MNHEEQNNRKSLDEIQNTCVGYYPDSVTDARICIINEEFKRGFQFMNEYPKSVTFFGSARLTEESPAFQNAVSLAEKLSKEGYAIVSGGGGGIMEAANKGAHLADGHSLGIAVELPFEQVTNEYVSDSIDFHHFFSRKVTLAYSAEAYIYFKGGFGTLDELFEILTLKQTGKIPPVPIILFGSEFWKPLEDYCKNVLLENKTISPQDLDIFVITDDEQEVIDIITNAPVREEMPISH